MKERPILFSAPMVRALLDGSKTQTRRVCKPAQAEALSCVVEVPDPAERGQVYNGSTFGDEDGEVQFSCPFGGRGDQLWVREAFAIETTQDYEGDPGILPALGPVKWEDDGGYRLIPRYRSSEPNTQLMIAPSEKNEIGMRWKPSIHMPRWASRILLEITDVRVEHLQDISEADAMAEGIVRQRDDGFGLADTTHYHAADPRMSYWSLWESINGVGSVETNPWVWAVSFRRLAAQIKNEGAAA